MTITKSKVRAADRKRADLTDHDAGIAGQSPGSLPPLSRVRIILSIQAMHLRWLRSWQRGLDEPLHWRDLVHSAEWAQGQCDPIPLRWASTRTAEAAPRPLELA